MAINLYNMGTIERTRVIRPSSRKDKSTYKVDIERRQEKDSLHLTVTHENDCNFRLENGHSSYSPALSLKISGIKARWKPLKDWLLVASANGYMRVP